MRAVFVNHCHPDMPHVCALRLRKFAESMAARGHQIVLLTESLDGQKSGPRAADLGQQLADHDWTSPFVVSVAPAADPVLRRLRASAYGKTARRGIILWRYLVDSGLYGDWQEAAAPYFEPLAATFRPDVVWASFGNSGVWNIGQALARRAGCPWVGDIKDNWQNFIPLGLRRLLAARYQDAAALTTFSEGQSAEADLWFHQPKTVVYSGFENAVTAPEKQDDKTFAILLSGSIYRDENLAGFVEGLETWLKRRKTNTAGAVRFSYAGNDSARVAEATRRLDGLCQLEINGFVPLSHLSGRQRTADVNAYIRMPGAFIFHHKLFELLAADRPLVVYPGEVPESLAIARGVDGSLYSCHTPQQVSDALTSCEQGTHPTVNRQNLARFAWSGQAEILEQVLEKARRRS